ncbi:MAG TPA: hypothetical protein VFX48_03430 [Saprospiraceae bacterium]|nr:hypothetical protein [Saprospiraceae bacterium]
MDFQFEDGDGDLGYGSRDERKDITIFDSRTGNVHDQYKLPDLPSSGDETQKGRISVLVFTTCCLFPAPIPPCSTPAQHPLDSLEFQIQLIDRAGHKSNLINSGKVYLNCR